MSMTHERRCLSVLLLLLCIALLLQGRDAGFSDLGAFSPMFFPRIVLSVLLFLAALNVISDLRIRTPSRPTRWKPVVIISVSLVLYVLAVMPLGYFLSSLVLGVVVLVCLGLRNPLVVLLVPALGAGALVGLFNHVLKMPLPVSPFFWWL